MNGAVHRCVILIMKPSQVFCFVTATKNVYAFQDIANGWIVPKCSPHFLFSKMSLIVGAAIFQPEHPRGFTGISQRFRDQFVSLGFLRVFNLACHWRTAYLRTVVLGALAFLSLVLLLWQWFVAVRFPLHRRAGRSLIFSPPSPCSNPLKAAIRPPKIRCEAGFSRIISGPIQILFGVASGDDPVCKSVRKLIAEFPSQDAQLVVCGPLTGANAKVSKLVELERLAKHDILVISDADVRVPPDFMANLVAPFNDSSDERRESSLSPFDGRAR